MLRYRIVDRPNARRVNTRPIPRAGGLAIAASFLLVAGGFVAPQRALPTGCRRRSPSEPADFLALFLGGAAAAALGGIDDLFDLRARWQLAGQIGLALFAVALGIGIAVINNPFGDDVIRFSEPFSVGFTIFWIVGMINSINWIDGLDGLSTGIALIASVTLGLLSLTTQVSQPLVAVLCFALAGALAGFLRWNFHPAKIFSGTSGVQFVGLHAGRAVDLRVGQGRGRAARARRADHRHVLDHRRRASAGAARRSRRTGRTSTIDCWTSGLSHRDTVLVIYGICAALGVLAMLADRAHPAVRVPRRVHRVRADPVRPDAGRVPAARGARGGRPTRRPRPPTH